MKVVINKCYGGFSVSLKAARWMAKRGHEIAAREVAEHDKKDKWIAEFLRTGKWPKECSEDQQKWLEIDAKYRKAKHWFGLSREVERNDPLLVQAVEKLGKDASGEVAKLEVVEIPDGIQWEIDEYDGNEHIAETHRTWG